jgi:hypothetical protein
MPLTDCWTAVVDPLAITLCLWPGPERRRVGWFNCQQKRPALPCMDHCSIPHVCSSLKLDLGFNRIIRAAPFFWTPGRPRFGRHARPASLCWLTCLDSLTCIAITPRQPLRWRRRRGPARSQGCRRDSGTQHVQQPQSCSTGGGYTRIYTHIHPCVRAWPLAA